ncbi:MAG: ABC transporter ATP-binding protein [Calditrichaeota bacterium]|nr:ABC transporter ATP-binding protein [Calditrichota bacterium]
MLSVKHLVKNYQTESQTVEVLRDVSFDISAGESLVITGPSGSGKSTLLHILGTLDSPTSGSVTINGNNPFSLADEELAKFRNQTVGFVFQDHHLLPQYSVLENVLLPTLAFPVDSHKSRDRATNLIEKVGLSHRINHLPAELSGGERQRVAIARALINAPAIVLCDEPTGNLDHSTADTLANVLFDLHRSEKNILVVVTHSLDLAQRFARKFRILDGKCLEEH